IDMQLPGAVLSFCWRFEELSGGEHTKLTQLLTLSGAKAHDFVEQVSIFEHTVPDGMRRLTSAIEAAARQYHGNEPTHEHVPDHRRARVHRCLDREAPARCRSSCCDL